MSIHLTPEFWEQVKPDIMQMHGGGKPWDAICGRIGVSPETMRRWRRTQPTLFPRTLKGSSWTAGRLQQAVYLWTHTRIGGTEIGRRLGVSKNALIGQMARAGLSPRSKHLVV